MALFLKEILKMDRRMVQAFISGMMAAYMMDNGHMTNLKALVSMYGAMGENM